MDIKSLFTNVSKKWLAVLIVIVVLNLAALICGIIVFAKSWIEMLIMAIVVVIDLVAYYFISKNIKPPA